MLHNQHKNTHDNQLFDLADEIPDTKTIALLIKQNPLGKVEMPGIFDTGISLKIHKNEKLAKLRNSIKGSISTRSDFCDIPPKIITPLNPSPGKLPKDIAEMKLKKIYERYSITEILDEVGINYKTITDTTSSMHNLPLDVYDDREFDCRTFEEYLDYINQTYKPLFGLGLRYYKSIKENKWEEAMIENYDKQLDIFSGKWIKDSQPFSLSKLKLFIYVFLNRAKILEFLPTDLYRKL